jgi:hypothetical protein
LLSKQIFFGRTGTRSIAIPRCRSGVKPSKEQGSQGKPQKGPSTRASTSTTGECKQYKVSGIDAIENWAHRVKAPKEATDKADEWLLTIETMGPDMLPHSTRTVRGREEHTSEFPEADLVISYQVLGPPICTVGIVDARSLEEDRRVL